MKMKSYIVMAYRFMEYAIRHINDIYDKNDIIDGVDIAAHHFHIHAHVTSGSARHVIVTDNFVIKWDMNVQCVHEIGGCENEIKMYDFARRCGFNYLLAKITPIYINKKYFYIMPFVPNIGPQYHKFKDIEYFLEPEEKLWIKKYIKDLHNYNWGLVDNKPIIIDYAFFK